MAQVALKREIEGYQKAIDQYQQAAARHNRAIDTYRASFLQDSKGNMRILSGSRAGYVSDGKILPYASYEGVRQGDGYAVRPKTLSHIKPPADFTKEPPKQDPSQGLSLAQLKTLNEPSMTDIERNQSSGLISTAFNS
jgi:hypothetical protein